MEINGKEVEWINVLLMDNDQDFRKRFSAYVAAYCSHISLTLTDGTAGGNLPEWLEKDPDLILVDAESGLAEKLAAAGLGGRTVVLLPKEPGGKSVDEQGVRYIFKYISASALISSIPEMAAGFGQVKICRKNADALMMAAVTGYYGGCGRTGFSIALAKMNRILRERTALVISTEKFPDIDDYFPNRTGFVSDSNLLLLNHLSGLSPEPARFLLEDECGIFALAPPSDGPSDINDLTEEDMEGFLQRIRNWELFDSVIVDTGCGDHRLDRFIFNNADYVFVLHDRRRMPGRSERRWLDKLYQSIERTPVIHVHNFSRLFEGVEKTGSFELPDDPASFIRKNGYTEILPEGKYAEGINRILKGNEYLL